MKRKRRLDPETARITIIGSGLAGLSTALALEKAGFQHISVYERDESFHHRKAGYGLTLTYHPTGNLQQLGVLDEVANADCPSRSHYLFDCPGHVLGYFGNGFCANRGWGQRGNLRVPRQVVRQIMLQHLKWSRIHWGHKLLDIQVSAQGVQLVLEQRQDAEALTVQADLLVAADGIRSTVVQTLLPRAPPPQPLGIRVILGLTDNHFQHALLHERGFYTLARGLRLFVMPFSAPSLLNPQVPVRYMWQLSFTCPLDYNMESTTNGKQLQQEALASTQNWHEPVQAMIQSTPLDSIWGTHLCDRDPTVLQTLLSEHTNVLIVGDALHAMSPFKGQGANQCLADGLTVAKCLKRASLQAACQSCMREMVQRTAPVVQASRQAAQYWHSPQACQATHKFASVADDKVPSLLTALHQGSITASTPHLDDCVAQVLERMGMSSSKLENCIVEDSQFVATAIQAATDGNLGRLRALSWSSSSRLRHIRSPDDDTLLHVAAASSGDKRLIYWLVTEAGCCPHALNSSGETPLDVARDPEIVQLLKQLGSVSPNARVPVQLD